MRFGLRELIFLIVLLAVPASALFIVFKPRNVEIQQALREIDTKRQRLDRLAQLTIGHHRHPYRLHAKTRARKRKDASPAGETATANRVAQARGEVSRIALPAEIRAERRHECCAADAQVASRLVQLENANDLAPEVDADRTGAPGPALEHHGLKPPSPGPVASALSPQRGRR